MTRRGFFVRKKIVFWRFRTQRILSNTSRKPLHPPNWNVLASCESPVLRSLWLVPTLKFLWRRFFFIWHFIVHGCKLDWFGTGHLVYCYMFSFALWAHCTLDNYFFSINWEVRTKRPSVTPRHNRKKYNRKFGDR